MNEASPKSQQMTSRDLSNVTFSQALADGLTHYGWLDGLTISQCGRDLALVSHLAEPARGKESKTNATYGPLFAGSSLTNTLQSCLESRLIKKLDVNGSPEYVLTCKHWDMSQGVPIYALRGRQRRISDREFTGWPSPAASDDQRGTTIQKAGDSHSHLPGTAALSGWPTPIVDDAKNVKPGPKRFNSLAAAVQMSLAGWSTPTAQDGSRGTRPPRARDTGHPLDQQAAMAGWATPCAKDSRGNHSDSWAQVIKPAGKNLKSLNASTEKSGALNPDHSRWLMGYPKEWGSCGVMAMQSIRGSRKHSLNQQTLGFK